MQRKLSKWLQISDLKSLDDVDRINTPRQVLYHGSQWNMIMRKCLCLSLELDSACGWRTPKLVCEIRIDLNSPKFFSSQNYTPTLSALLANR